MQLLSENTVSSVFTIFAVISLLTLGLLRADPNNGVVVDVDPKAADVFEFAPTKTLPVSDPEQVRPGQGGSDYHYAVFVPSLKFNVAGNFADPPHYIEIWWVISPSDASIQITIMGATHATRASVFEEGKTDPKDALGTRASKNLVPEVFDVSLKKGKKYFIRVQASTGQGAFQLESSVNRVFLE